MNRLPNTTSSSSRTPSRSEDANPVRGGGSSPSPTQSTAESSTDSRFLAQGARPRTTRQSPSSTTQTPIEKRQITQIQSSPHTLLHLTVQRLEGIRYMATHAPDKTLLPDEYATTISQYIKQGNDTLTKEGSAFAFQQGLYKELGRVMGRLSRPSLTAKERKIYEIQAKQLSEAARIARTEYDITLEESAQFITSMRPIIQELCIDLSLIGVLTTEAALALTKDPTIKLTPKDVLPSYDLLQVQTFTQRSPSVPLPMYTHPSVQQASPPPYSPEDAERGRTILQNLPPAYEEPQGAEATPPPRRVDPQTERDNPPLYTEKEEE